MPRGNTSGPRGHPTKRRYTLDKAAALQLQGIAWLRYGRPTTEAETSAVLAALIAEEAQRIAPNGAQEKE